MQFPMIMLLFVASWLLWTVAYLLVIRQGFKDKTYGMPFPALCANLCWEFSFLFVFPFEATFMIVLNGIWFVLDLVIAYQFLKYGPREFPDIPRWLFYPMAALGMVMAFFAIYVVTKEAADQHGYYAGFGADLLMKMCFVAMLYRRGSLRGQNMWIAACKALGTLSVSVGTLWFHPQLGSSLVMQYLIVGIVLFDLIYLAMVYVHRVARGEPVWAL